MLLLTKNKKQKTKNKKQKTKNKKAILLRPPTHGLSKTPEYSIWNGMVHRCTDKKQRSYINYGGRGIKVCERWLTFENFYKDMGKRPVGLTLERINNNKGYSKENCKWATHTEQMRNRRLHKRNISGVSGVTWSTVIKKWIATASLKGKCFRLGQFSTIKEAAIVRKLWEEDNW